MKKYIISMITMFTLLFSICIYAAFTSNTSFEDNSIVIGKVDINATIDNSASGKINLQNLKTGDTSTHRISVDNNSDYDIQYRTIIKSDSFTSAEDYKILDVLTFKIGDELIDFKAGYGQTSWYSEEALVDFEYDLSISLKSSINNEYFDSQFDFSVKIESRHSEDLGIDNQTDLDEMVNGEYVKLNQNIDSLVIDKDLYLNLDGYTIDNLQIIGDIDYVEILNGNIGTVYCENDALILMYAICDKVELKEVESFCYFADSLKREFVSSLIDLYVGNLILDSNLEKEVTLYGDSSVINYQSITNLTVDTTDAVEIINYGDIETVDATGNNVTIEGVEYEIDESVAYLSSTDENYYFTDVIFKQATKIDSISDIQNFDVIYLNNCEVLLDVDLKNNKIIGLENVVINIDETRVFDNVSIENVVINVECRLGVTVNNTVYLKECLINGTESSTLFSVVGLLESEDCKYSDAYIAHEIKIGAEISSTDEFENCTYIRSVIRNDKNVLAPSGYYEEADDTILYRYMSTVYWFDDLFKLEGTVYILRGTYIMGESYQIHNELNVIGIGDVTLEYSGRYDAFITLCNENITFTNIKFRTSLEGNILFATYNEIEFDIEQSGFDFIIATINTDKIVVSDGMNHFVDNKDKTATIYLHSYTDIDSITETNQEVYVLNGTYVINDLKDNKYIGIDNVVFKFEKTFDNTNIEFNNITIQSQYKLFNGVDATYIFDECYIACESIVTSECSVIITNCAVDSTVAFDIADSTVVSNNNNYVCDIVGVLSGTTFTSEDDTFTSEEYSFYSYDSELIVTDETIKSGELVIYVVNEKTYISTIDSYFDEVIDGVSYRHELTTDNLENYQYSLDEEIYLSGTHNLTSQMTFNNVIVKGITDAKITGSVVCIDSTLENLNVIANNEFAIDVRGNSNIIDCFIENTSETGVKISEDSVYTIQSSEIKGLPSIKVESYEGSIINNKLNNYIYFEETFYDGFEKVLPFVSGNDITMTTIYYSSLNKTIHTTMLWESSIISSHYSNDDIEILGKSNNSFYNDTLINDVDAHIVTTFELFHFINYIKFFGVIEK